MASVGAYPTCAKAVNAKARRRKVFMENYGSLGGLP